MRNAWGEIDARRSKMSLGMILLIVVLIALVAAMPTWGYSKNWSFGPSGSVGLVLLVLVISMAMGKI
jgi:hypothetical protein